MNDTGKIRKGENDGFVTMFFAALYFFITYVYVYHKMNIGGMNDYPAHVYNILSLFRGSNPIEGWMAAPHCFWHLTVLFFFSICKMPFQAAAAFSTCLYSLLYYFILLWVIKKVAERYNVEMPSVKLNVIALSFTFVQALYFYFLDTGERYLGVFSPNPLHNPTQMCVRGFAVLAFCLVVDILQKELAFKDAKKTYIYVAVLLFLSAVMKPTFAEMFIPTVGLYMLFTWIYKLIKKNEPGEYFKKCLTMLACSAPALAYMLLQYIVFFFFEGSYGSEGGVVFTKWMEVWKLFSDNIFLSILLGMAFPIYMLIIDPPFFMKNIAGRLAVIGYGVALIEAAILGESGNRLNHGNFLWPLMSGMLIWWLVAILRLIVIDHETKAETGSKRALIMLGWFLFFCHVFCGILFYRAEMMGL